MQPGLDSHDAGAYDLRHLFIREAFEVPQDQDDLVVRRKGLDGLPKHLLPLLLEEQFLRALREVRDHPHMQSVLGELRQVLIDRCLDKPSSPELHQGRIDGDSVEPRAEGRSTLEAGDLPIDGEKDVLEDLLGICRVLGQRQGEPVYPFLITPQEHLKGCLFARLYPLDEFLIRPTRLFRGHPFRYSDSTHGFAEHATMTDLFPSQRSWPFGPPAHAVALSAPQYSEMPGDGSTFIFDCGIS